MGSVCHNCPGDITQNFNIDNTPQFTQEIQSIINTIRDNYKQQIKNIKNNQLPKGKLFRGCIVQGKKNGYGQLFYGNHAYFGMFKNDVPEGEGVMIKGMKDYVKGNFKKGKLSGEVRQKVNKIQFIGKYFEGQKLRGVLKTQTYTYEGQGLLSFKNGDIYKGNFKNGVYHGEGKYSTSEEGTYQGFFCYGMYDGKGVFKWKNDYYYQGEYKKGMRNGYGKFVMGNQQYEGIWVDGQPQRQSKFGKNEQIIENKNKNNIKNNIKNSIKK